MVLKFQDPCEPYNDFSKRKEPKKCLEIANSQKQEKWTSDIILEKEDKNDKKYALEI